MNPNENDISQLPAFKAFENSVLTEEFVELLRFKDSKIVVVGINDGKAQLIYQGTPSGFEEARKSFGSYFAPFKDKMYTIDLEKYAASHGFEVPKSLGAMSAVRANGYSLPKTPDVSVHGSMSD